MRVESLELRVEIWCVRCADTILYGSMIFMAIFPLVSATAKQQGGVKTPPYITNP